MGIGNETFRVQRATERHFIRWCLIRDIAQTRQRSRYFLAQGRNFAFHTLLGLSDTVGIALDFGQAVHCHRVLASFVQEAFTFQERRSTTIGCQETAHTRKESCIFLKRTKGNIQVRSVSVTRRRKNVPTASARVRIPRKSAT